MADTLNLENALSLFHKENYEGALEMLEPLATEGSAEAQAYLGVMYQLGLGVERNVPEAFQWLTRAAQQGVGFAAHNLGTLHQTCEPDFPADFNQSRYWFERARELGFNPAGL